MRQKKNETVETESKGEAQRAENKRKRRGRKLEILHGSIQRMRDRARLRNRRAVTEKKKDEDRGREM